MSYTANTSSLLPNAGPQAYLQYASPVESTSTTVTITFPPISQGLQALVSVNVPNGTGYQTFMVYLNGSIVGSMVGNNPFGPLNLNGGDIVSLSGPTVTGNGVMTGSIGPSGTLSLSPVVASGGTSGSVALTEFVLVTEPDAGSNFTYTYPTPLRLVGGAFLLTTSSANAERSIYLNQAPEGGGTLASLLCPFAIGPSTDDVQVEFGEGMTTSVQQTRIGTSGSCPSSVSPVYTASGWVQDATVAISNSSGSTVEGVIYMDGYLFVGDISSPGSISVQVNMQPGDELQIGGEGASWALNGWAQGSIFTTSVSGILMPTGSTVSSDIGNIQSGDQISGASLFFTQS